jgi:hypothetical protein
LLLTSLTGAAIANPGEFGDKGDKGGKGGGWSNPWSPPSPQAAPEIEIASAGAALALLVGGVIVLRGRKARKQD